MGQYSSGKLLLEMKRVHRHPAAETELHVEAISTLRNTFEINEIDIAFDLQAKVTVMVVGDCFIEVFFSQGEQATLNVVLEVAQFYRGCLCPITENQVALAYGVLYVLK
jgi:hypothetical protein